MSVRDAHECADTDNWAPGGRASAASQPPALYHQSSADSQEDERSSPKPTVQGDFAGTTLMMNSLSAHESMNSRDPGRSTNFAQNRKMRQSFAAPLHKRRGSVSHYENMARRLTRASVVSHLPKRTHTSATSATSTRRRGPPAALTAQQRAKLEKINRQRALRDKFPLGCFGSARHHRFAVHMSTLRDSVWFRGLIILIIILAGVQVGIQTYASARDQKDVASALSVMDIVVQVLFITEILVKFAAEGRQPWKFFQEPWNVFDFMVVLATLLPFDSGAVVVLRMLRLLRVLRLVRALPKLQILVVGLTKSLSAIGWISFLLGILFYMYGVLGVSLFARNDPVWFGTLQVSLLTLFQCATLDDWTDVMYTQIQGCAKYGYTLNPDECVSTDPQPMVSVAFFSSFIIIANLLVLNLFIGVVSSSMDKAKETLELEMIQAREDKEAEIRKLRGLDVDHATSKEVKFIEAIDRRTKELDFELAQSLFELADMLETGFWELDEMYTAVDDIRETSKHLSKISVQSSNSFGLASRSQLSLFIPSSMSLFAQKVAKSLRLKSKSKSTATVSHPAELLDASPSEKAKYSVTPEQPGRAQASATRYAISPQESFTTLRGMPSRNRSQDSEPPLRMSPLGNAHSMPTHRASIAMSSETDDASLIPKRADTAHDLLSPLHDAAPIGATTSSSTPSKSGLGVASPKQIMTDIVGLMKGGGRKDAAAHPWRTSESGPDASPDNLSCSTPVGKYAHVAAPQASPKAMERAHELEARVTHSMGVKVQYAPRPKLGVPPEQQVLFSVPRAQAHAWREEHVGKSSQAVSASEHDTSLSQSRALPSNHDSHLARVRRRSAARVSRVGFHSRDAVTALSRIRRISLYLRQAFADVDLTRAPDPAVEFASVESALPQHPSPQHQVVRTSDQSWTETSSSAASPEPEMEASMSPNERERHEAAMKRTSATVLLQAIAAAQQIVVGGGGRDAKGKQIKPVKLAARVQPRLALPVKGSTRFGRSALRAVVSSEGPTASASIARERRPSLSLRDLMRLRQSGGDDQNDFTRPFADTAVGDGDDLLADVTASTDSNAGVVVSPLGYERSDRASLESSGVPSSVRHTGIIQAGSQHSIVRGAQSFHQRRADQTPPLEEADSERHGVERVGSSMSIAFSHEAERLDRALEEDMSLRNVVVPFQNEHS